MRVNLLRMTLFAHAVAGLALTVGVVSIAGCGNPDSAIRIFPAVPTATPTPTPLPSPTPTAVPIDVSERADFLRKEAARVFDAWDDLWGALLRAARWAIRDYRLRNELERAIREFRDSDRESARTVESFPDEVIASEDFLDLMDEFVDVYRDVLPDVRGISDVIVASDRLLFGDEQSIEARFRAVESRLRGWSSVRLRAPK